YTGHGSRGKNKNDKWPEFYLAGSRERMDFSFVKASLSKKNPRFILAIADCCNNFRSQTVKKEIMSLASSGHSQWLANLHTLFLGKTQAVFISAASPGEYAWAYENQGGVFTLSFFEYFRKLLGNTNPITWELILSKVQKDISCFQNPQFEIISY
ncbi:MAG: caspase family protein, partial [Waddliaceae bacterium]